MLFGVLDVRGRKYICDLRTSLSISWRKDQYKFFYPLYSLLGELYFLKLVDKHFKHDNKLHKIFNRKTLKISYSWTKNIFQIINSHNKNIIKDFQDQINNNNNNNCIKKECNCKSRDNCPMNGLCYLNDVISSSCRAASTDIPNPLSPLLPIIHCLRQVFRITSCVFT